MSAAYDSKLVRGTRTGARTTRTGRALRLQVVKDTRRRVIWDVQPTVVLQML